MITTIISGIFTIFGGMSSFKTIMQTVMALWETDQKGRIQDDLSAVRKADEHLSTSEDIHKAAEADAQLNRDL